jgi:tetratricopeptide (TPR) repeat protein
MENTEPENPHCRSLWPWGAAALCLILVLFALMPRQKRGGAAEAVDMSQKVTAFDRSSPLDAHPPSLARPGGGAVSAEEIVAGKVVQFTKNRRDVLRAMAKEYKLQVPPEIEAFFDAAERGQWDELNERFTTLRKLRQGTNGPPELGMLWGPILETLGVAESAHDWPAQRLLDYGNSILDSLRPGMVYVGGTDPGRFIPTLLNETSDGEHHVVLTQNGLADNSYLDYLRFLYGKDLQTLTSDDSQKAFQNYMDDAQKRLAHDEQFPDEPKQLRPGENIQVTDGRVEVSGQIAVMGINELLLQMFMDKNPDLSFALEESFPLRSTYSNAAPLGPITQLRVTDDQNALTAETAAQSLDYWRAASQQILAETAGDTPEGQNVLKAYSKMAASEGNLFADRNLDAEAEQAYRLGMQIYPDNPEATYGLANLLAREGKIEEAQRMVKEFQQKNPEQAQSGTWTATSSR